MSDVQTEIEKIRELQDYLKQRLDDDQAALKELAKRLWAQQESEKAKLSRELHDGVGQLLTGLTRRLQSLSESSPEVKELHGIAEMALHDVRQLSRLMSPTILDDLGLKPALNWLCRNLLEGEIEYEATIDVPATISKDISMLIFRIAQEALVNTVKYSECEFVSLHLFAHHNVIRLDIIDNGIGFDQNTINPGVGLSSIKDRADAFSATLEIASSIGNGTRITILVPV